MGKVPESPAAAPSPQEALRGGGGRLWRRLRRSAAAALLTLALLFPGSGLAGAQTPDGAAPETCDPPHDWRLSLGLYTWHVDTSDDTNELNWLTGVTYRNYMGAHFVNSYYNVTWFAARRFPFRKYRLPGHRDWFARVNLYAGIVYGYRNKDNVPNYKRFTPALLPTLDLGYKDWSVEVLYIPTGSGGVFTTWLNYAFGL